MNRLGFGFDEQKQEMNHDKERVKQVLMDRIALASVRSFFVSSYEYNQMKGHATMKTYRKKLTAFHNWGIGSPYKPPSPMIISYRFI